MKKEPHTEKRNKETGIQNETPEVYGVERGPDGIELRRRDFLALAAASAANAAIGAGARCAWGQEKKINELPQSGRVGVKTRKNVIPRLNLVPHSEVTSVAFSPDGALLAASSPTKLWNGNPTNCVQKLKESYVHNIETIAFNPSGQILVASGEHKIAIYDPRKGKRLGIVKTSWGGCYSLVFSPDGKRLASGELGKIRLLDPRSWKCVGVLTDQCRENIRSMSFSPNGKLLASRHRDRGEKDREILKIWDFQKEECLRTLDGFWGAALAFHPDGNMLAASIVHWKRGTGIVLINVRTGKEKRFLKGHRGPVNSICFSPDGKLLISGGTRGRIKFWNVETGKCLMTIHWKRSENLCLSLNPDGRTLAVGDKRGDIILMDIEDPSTVWYLFSRKRFLGQLVQARDLDSKPVTLTQGMSRRKVRELLGEPDTTAKAGSREIWKYEEGEAIVFEEGKLKQHERDEVAKKDPLGIDIKGKQGIDRFLGNGNARGPGGNVCACDTVLFSAKTGLAKGMVCVCNTISGYGKRDGVRRANKRLCTCNYICTCNMVCTVNTVGKDCGCVGVCGCESVVCRSVNMR